MTKKVKGLWVGRKDSVGSENLNQYICVVHDSVNNAVALRTAITAETTSGIQYFVGDVDTSSTNNTGEIFNDYTSNTASGAYSHAEGNGTMSSNDSEHAEGKYNVSISSSTIHTVGIGTSSERKNAHTITNDGKHYIPGIGGYQGTESSLTGKEDLAMVINSKSDSSHTHYIGTTQVQPSAAAQAVTGIISVTYGTTAGNKCTEIYDTNNKCLKFVFS